MRYRCVNYNGRNQCMLKCPDEDCDDSTNVCTTTINGVSYSGVCEIGAASNYGCRSCKIDTPDPTTTRAAATDPGTTGRRCSISWGTITSQNSASYCGLTLEDCTIIPEDQVDDTYKEQMIGACPDLEDCWDTRISMNSCQCLIGIFIQNRNIFKFIRFSALPRPRIVVLYI